MNSVSKGGSNFVMLALKITNVILNERDEMNALKKQITDIYIDANNKGIDNKSVDDIINKLNNPELLKSIVTSLNSNDKDVKLALSFILSNILKSFTYMNHYDVELIKFCSMMKMNDDHIINLLVLDNAYLLNEYLQSIGFGTMSYKIIAYRKNGELYRINQLYK